MGWDGVQQLWGGAQRQSARTGNVPPTSVPKLRVCSRESFSWLSSDCSADSPAAATSFWAWPIPAIPRGGKGGGGGEEQPQEGSRPRNWPASFGDVRRASPSLPHARRRHPQKLAEYLARTEVPPGPGPAAKRAARRNLEQSGATGSAGSPPPETAGAKLNGSRANAWTTPYLGT